MNDLPYGRQSIDNRDIAAVEEVLRGDWLTQGPAVEAFERSIADRVGADFAVAFSSGTAALHGAAHAAGLGPGDLVVTSPLTFMATANAARYVGATPVLADIDPTTWNLDLSKVPQNADGAIPVHFAGLPLDLGQWAERAPIVIEDAAHALGAGTENGPVGNCADSDLCCFSFHPVKPITTGEGGAVTTMDPELADRLRRFRSHGIVRRPEHGGWFYEIAEMGFNYRMTDIQAALGLAQLKRLDEFIQRRNDIADRYRSLLAPLPLTLPPEAPGGAVHGYHLFPVLLADRRRVYDELHRRGIRVQVHYVPVHHHPISRDIDLPADGLPACDDVYERILSLPIFPELTEEDQDGVVQALEDILA